MLLWTSLLLLGGHFFIVRMHAAEIIHAEAFAIGGRTPIGAALFKRRQYSGNTKKSHPNHAQKLFSGDLTVF